MTTTFTPITLTTEEVTRLMEEAVSKKGVDYVHPGICAYLDDEQQPSCLIGHVLVSAGVPVEVIRAFEGTVAWRAVPAVLDIPAVVIDALQAAQVAQDNRYTWREALGAYKAVLDGSQ